MALIERYEYHVIEGEDEYGEAVAWLTDEDEARAKLAELGDGHVLVKVTYYCNEYEVMS